MWLLLIDAYSKWPEVHAMSSTTAQATVQQLRKIFATHGLPQMIVSIMVPNLCPRSLNNSVPQGAFNTTL